MKISFNATGLLARLRVGQQLAAAEGLKTQAQQLVQAVAVFRLS